MIPIPTRRRKRRLRPTQSNVGPNQPHQHSSTSTTKSARKRGKSATSLLDDKSLNFLDRQGDSLDQQKAISHPLPVLLDQRRLGSIPRSQQERWQRKMLQTFTEKPKSQESGRRQWRSFSRRVIPFTKLSTPRKEAVLALERHASYVLTLGSDVSSSSEDQDEGVIRLALAIRFYGVPSPASVQVADACRSGQRVVPARSQSAVLLQTIPLVYEHLGDRNEEAMMFFQRTASPSVTPVRVIVSSDWRLGIALFEASPGALPVWKDKGKVATLVLFAMPNHTASGYDHAMSKRQYSRIYRCTNVSMSMRSQCSPHNLLWRVQVLPMGIGCFHAKTTQTQERFEKIHRSPGWLFLNDEEDGFRLTWASHAEWNDASIWYDGHSNTLAQSATPTASLPILEVQNTWEEVFCDQQTGLEVPVDDLDQTTPSSSIRVVSEAFLHIDVLLQAIFVRCKGLAGDSPAEFHYSLIRVYEEGRTANLVITFIRRRRAQAIGVFVSCDLFTGNFKEDQWVKKRGSDISLRKWCDQLALNRRMKQMGVGPFCSALEQGMDWTCLCEKSSFDHDADDNWLPDLWRPYVKALRDNPTTKKKPPKLISMSSLYPEADVVTNKALTACLPVSSITCKDAPVELAYQ